MLKEGEVARLAVGCVLNLDQFQLPFRSKLHSHEDEIAKTAIKEGECPSSFAQQPPEGSPRIKRRSHQRLSHNRQERLMWRPYPPPSIIGQISLLKALSHLLHNFPSARYLNATA
jgi:hypothetical protein